MEGELDEAAAAAQLAEWHVTPLRWEKILHAKHEFTHLRWRMTGYLLTAAGEGEPDWLWADAARGSSGPSPRPFRYLRRRWTAVPQRNEIKKEK